MIMIDYDMMVTQRQNQRGRVLDLIGRLMKVWILWWWNDDYDVWSYYYFQNDDNDMMILMMTEILNDDDKMIMTMTRRQIGRSRFECKIDDRGVSASKLSTPSFLS